MMGAVCACGSDKKPSSNSVKQKISVVSESNTAQVSVTPSSTSNIHSSQEILDDSFKAQITEAIDEYIVTIPTAYQTERDRIVNEMSRSAPSCYLGLLFSEYPDVNGTIVNEMALRLVTSNEIKQQLVNQIDQRIEPSFASRTTDWNSSSRDAARPVVRVFIEKLVNDAFHSVEIK